MPKKMKEGWRREVTLIESSTGNRCGIILCGELHTGGGY